MARYVALVDGEAGAYGVQFPDASGCTAMGATLDEALQNATEALAEWVSDEVADMRQIPPARSMESVRADVEVKEAIANGAIPVLVALIQNSGKPVRANLSLDAGLLKAIDEAAERAGLTRSAFLASAAREKIDAGV